MINKDVARSLFEQVPGRGNRHALAAGTPIIPQTQAKRQDTCVNRLQMGYLRRLHGLTEAQASAIAALIWGALQ